MTKYIKTAIVILSILTSVLLWGGCRRVSHNGKIDGNWIITSIIRTSDGAELLPVADRGLLSIAIQCELFQTSGASVCTGELTYNEDAERLTVDFRAPKNLSMPMLNRYGIMTNPVTFSVDVNKHHLILTTPETIITCKKW